MNSEEYRKADIFLRNKFYSEGREDFPYIFKQTVDLKDLSLIRFSDTSRLERKNKQSTVHFFQDDYKFDEVWNKPDNYIKKLSQYKQVCTPDFSQYIDMPIALQIYNVFRNRWCGAKWQSEGMTVIPTVSWSDEYGMDFSFNSIQEGSTVSVTTLGCKEVKKGFMEGYIEMLTRIKPEAVICYSEPFEEMLELSKVIEVPYLRATKIAPMKPSQKKLGAYGK